MWCRRSVYDSSAGNEKKNILTLLPLPALPARFDWYKHTVGITAQNQAKFWFYKRFASPWLVSGYR